MTNICPKNHSHPENENEKRGIEREREKKRANEEYEENKLAHSSGGGITNIGHQNIVLYIF